MEIVSHQIDINETGALVHITVLGNSTVDDSERVAHFSEQTALVLDADNIQAWLDAWFADNAVAIQAAIDAGELADSDQKATGANRGAKQWFIDNPNGQLLYTLTIAELEAEIDALDFSSMPAGAANKLKLLLKTLSISERVFARRLELI